MNNLTKRIIFGAIYIAIVILATTTTNYAFAIIFGAFMLFCTYEFNKMNKVKSVFPYLINFGLFLSVTSYYLFKNSIDISYMLLFIVLLITSFTFINELFQKNKTNNISTTFTNIFYIGLPFTLLILIYNNSSFEIINIALAIFILLWVNDSFAYLVGKNFGKNKLFERISPKKTIEGFIGGLIFTLIAGIIIAKYNQIYMHDVKEHLYPTWIIIALIVSIFGTIGDLIESMFKRQAGIKDSSNLIPGHGGFLDRLDSFIFVIPFIFIYLNLFS
jgi:phosphatidate cytidylyltransferase